MGEMGETMTGVPWVLGAPGCDACRRTLAILDAHAVVYEYFDVSTWPEEKVQELRDAGLVQLPVVRTADAVWTGHRPDMLRELTRAAR